MNSRLVQLLFEKWLEEKHPLFYVGWGAALGITTIVLVILGLFLIWGSLDYRIFLSNFLVWALLILGLKLHHNFLVDEFIKTKGK